MGASRVFIPRMLLGAPMMGQCLMAGCKESQFYSLPFGQLSPQKILISTIYYSTVPLLFEFPQKTCTYPLGKLITEFTGPRLSVSYFLYPLYEVEELLGQLLEAAAPMACRNSFPQAGVGSIKSEPDSMWEGVPSRSGLFKRWIALSTV